MSLDLMPERRQGLLHTPLNVVISAALEGIVIVDEQQLIVMLNPTAQRMFGYAPDELLGCPLARLMPKRFQEGHAALVRLFAKTSAADSGVRSGLTLRGLRADGEEFPVEATVSRMDVAGIGGRHRYFMALLRDLSKERQLKERIHTLEQLLPTISDLAPVAIWIARGDDIIFANRACAQLFGVKDARDLLGQSIYALLRPQSHGAIRKHVSDTLSSPMPLVAIRETIARPDGDLREVEIAMVPMPDHGATTLQMVINDVTQRREEAAELERSHQELRQLSANAVEAREEERHRIARELHDELGQRLTALKMELSGLRMRSAAHGDGPRIDAMLEMLDDTMASVRRIASDLRPLMLDDLGLNAAIQWLARDAAKRTGIAISTDLGAADPPLTSQAAIALYRMVQEALTNVARHAQATEVHIRMELRDNEVALSVHDNGVGFPDRLTIRTGSFGLAGIRERTSMLGGYVEVDNPSAGGGRIVMHLPITAQPDPPALEGVLP